MFVHVWEGRSPAGGLELGTSPASPSPVGGLWQAVCRWACRVGGASSSCVLSLMWVQNVAGWGKRSCSGFNLLTMDPTVDGETSVLHPEPDSRAAGTPGCAFLHKSIIVMVMGSLMSAVGGLLFLLRSLEAADVSRSVASACVSIGLMFVVLGLVWIPILKEKRRRMHFSRSTWRTGSLVRSHLLYLRIFFHVDTRRQGWLFFIRAKLFLFLCWQQNAAPIWNSLMFNTCYHKYTQTKEGYEGLFSLEWVDSLDPHIYKYD